MARKRSRSRRKPRARDVLTWVVVAAIALPVVFVLSSHLYEIPSSAMEPTFKCARPGVGCTASTNDRIIVPRFFFKSADRGDVIAFRTPPLARARCGSGGIFVKRVVGLPGERFAERTGTILIDGKALREPYIRPARRDLESFPERRVPDDAYFVLGDNRARSCDSRIWGAVPKDNVIGRVVATYWPPSRIGFR